VGNRVGLPHARPAGISQGSDIQVMLAGNRGLATY